MSSHTPKEIIIDVRGQVCPSTLLVAMEKMNLHQLDLREGKVILQVLTDNRSAIATIPGTAKNMGYTVTVKDKLSYYDILIRRTES